MSDRKLLDGRMVPEGDLRTVSVTSRVPNKWLFVDLETGQIWKPVVQTPGMFTRLEKGDFQALAIALLKVIERGDFPVLSI